MKSKLALLMLAWAQLLNELNQVNIGDNSIAST